MPLGDNGPCAEADHHQDRYARAAREIHDVLTLKSVPVVRLISCPIVVFGASVATVRYRREPQFPFETAAVWVVRIERRGNLSLPRLERGQDRRQNNECGAGCAEETADHCSPQRRALPAAFAQAE